MSRLHDPGSSRARLVPGYLLSIVASLAVLVAGLLKFFRQVELLDPLERLGLAEHAPVIGLVEVAVAVVYWIPRTANLGFFLFCGYIGGIVVGEIMLGEPPLPGLALGAMIYLGTLMRKPSLLG